ncbi:methanethiol S-methyltransferase [Sphingomonas antarctica]|uniref:methanethiol S-methyltransferase n=1 Tax=Sphingomonas antarctica TaxID=2040274 RepID=UPI0039EBD40C
MSRSIILLFGSAAYVFFFATFLYLIAFVGNLPWVPLTIDRGPIASTGMASVVDLLLVALFGVQHSVMARPGFKAAWTKVVPKALERSVYVVASSLMLILLYAFWRPIVAPLWTVTAPAGQILLWALFGLGWGIVLLSTFLISHFELFGLTQVWTNWRRREIAPMNFVTPFLYKFVRHPLYLGFLIAMWSIPAMTLGHALFAGAMTVYVLIAIRYEERDLVAQLGHEYVDYRGRVGMLTPKLR